jgi:hypothetical protein
MKVKPSNLYISTTKNDSFVRLINNKSTTINCIAENSNPGCDFIWYLGKLNIQNQFKSVIYLMSLSLRF